MALRVVRAELPPDELLTRLRAGESQLLDGLYRAHHTAFVRWAEQRYPVLTTDELDDVFQEAIIDLYESIISAQITAFTASPRSILFGFGSRRCTRLKKKSDRTVKILDSSVIKSSETFTSSDFLSAESVAALPTDPYDLDDFESEHAHRVQQVTHALHQLTPDCHRLLTAFFYDNQSIAVLTASMEYRDVNVTSSCKSQCLRRLRVLCGISAE